MCTKLINKHRISLFIIISIFTGHAVAKSIHAKNYKDAINKIEKRQSSGNLTHYLGLERHYMLAYNHFIWDYDSYHEDTIYVCQTEYMNSSIYNEYILTRNRIYSVRAQLGRSMEYKVYSNKVECRSASCILYDDIYKASDIFEIRCINYVKNWDVDLFERWSQTTTNDFTSINAIRIIKLSEHKFKYDYYSFYDNYEQENEDFW